MPNKPASLQRQGETLYLSGQLIRPGIAAAWRAALPLLPGCRRLDIAAVQGIDSAGLAFLAALAHEAGNGIEIDGLPPGYAELRDTYRLDARLGTS